MLDIYIRHHTWVYLFFRLFVCLFKVHTFTDEVCVFIEIPFKFAKHNNQTFRHVYDNSVLN